MARTGYRGPGCPRCTEPLAADLGDGYHTCRHCWTPVEVRRFQPHAVSGAQPLPNLEADGTPCAHHAANRAEASCDRCGVFMCGLCRVAIDGRCLCPPCFDRLAVEGSLPSAVVHRRNWCGMAIHLAFCSLVPFIGMVLAPAAIWTAIVGLRRNRATGERLSHVAGIVALPLAGIGLLISGVMLVLIVKAATR